MFLINADNVNHALYEGLHAINALGTVMDSRNGKVLKFDAPVVTAYKYPQERVLFDPLRDANPFFHMFESIWMLGGKNDVALPAKYAAQIKNYSDDGETLHGAYGHRWRNHFGYDQIDKLIFNLAKDPLSRREVLGMWDPYIDPSVAELGGRDIPCNTQVFFNIRPNNELDMTVTNRSNDLVWGAYGANAVHMSILHEYVALSVGVPMGTYYQFSNDMHVYEKYFPLVKASEKLIPYLEPYDDTVVLPTPLFDKPGAQGKKAFDLDIETFLTDQSLLWNNYRTDFFAKTVAPMHRAWELHKGKMPTSAREVALRIEGPDWRKAVLEWLARREPK